MITDPISDYIVRIRNASLARHPFVDIPVSILKKDMTTILYDQGYISSYKICETNLGRSVIRIAVKYDQLTGQPVISQFKRISKPGLRKYVSVKEFQSFYNGLGVSILSTSRGVISGGDTKRFNVGGELLCCVF